MKKNLFLLSGILVLSFSSQAQELKEDYMTWPESSKLGQYVSSWVPGEDLFEDENFYVSRVKPKERFRNAATQIDETLTEANDRKLVFWVPVGNASNGNTNARPNGKFDSEAFSTWSYVTHYGDWTAPHGWVPGGFADVAHKNGVGVSGVASVPWGGISSEWSSGFSTLVGIEAETVAKFLHYHGVDGLGYNSEFSTGSSFILSGLRALHETVHKYLMEKGNPVVENFWYDGTNDNGQITFDSGLGNHNNDTFGDGEHIRTSLFLNYNWHGVLGGLTQSTVDTYAPGRSSLDLYAGFNMQGGDPSTWRTLKDYNLSIGLWGAHDYNMLWADRANNGSTDVAKQTYYQHLIEQFFTNGNRNPIDKIEVYNRGNHHPDDKWFGMSAFMTARSSLKWDLSEEPFISYFNLGNGRFLNWMGERQNDNEWYNIGVQDYLPTWRWWFASDFMGKTADKVVENGLEAKFTYDDAYVGGSCLRLFGSVDNEYLHLFKTEFALSAADVITVRYKLVGGQADVNLALSAKGDEQTILRESGFKVLTVADEADDEVWVEKTFKVSGSLAMLAGKEIAMVALHFENAENLDLYLGEFSITRGAMPTPAAPEIKIAKVLASHYKGVDGKVIFNMDNDKLPGEPVYNLDVNASMFKLYAQQKGGEPQFMGITTSWAGMYFSVPTDLQGEQEIRFGVAAVSVDMKSDSEIAWSDYMSMGEYTVTDDIQINKTTIKPGESFEISYVDPRHAAADWKLLNSTGEVVKEASNTTVFTVSEGIEEIGGYDLQVICDGETTTYGYYVQITSEAVGALPEIQSLTIGGEAVAEDEVKIDVDEALTLGYTGRKANGASSRGIEINEGWVGGRMSDLSIGDGQTFSVSAWVRFTSIPEGSCFFSVENRASSAWPVNNWGWMWSDLSSTGKLNSYTFRTATYNGAPELKYTFPNAVVTPNAWNHVVLTFEYNDQSQFRSKFYLNGVLQESTWVLDGASGTTETWANVNYSITTSDWFCFAGGRGSEPVFNNGIIDDLLVWNGAMTPEQVQNVKNGLDANSLPQEVMAYWDFETDADEDHYFAAKGSVAGAKACSFKTEALGSEGAGRQVAQNPLYISGCPFVPGSTFKVETRPTWTAKRGVLSESTGTDLEGSTKLTYSKPGDYTVTLTLENTLGADTKSYPVFKVGDVDGVEESMAGELRTYTVEGILFVEFAEDGDYQVGVYNASGMLVAQKDAAVVAGQNMSISLGAKGVYVVKVMKEGKVVRTVKVLNR